MGTGELNAGVDPKMDTRPGCFMLLNKLQLDESLCSYADFMCTYLPSSECLLNLIDYA